MILYNSETFEERNQVPLEIEKSNTREPNVIISIQADTSQSYLGILCGKKLIMNEQKPCTLFIYCRHMLNYVPYRTIDLKKHKIFE